MLICLTIIWSSIPFFHIILSYCITFKSFPQQRLLSLRTGQCPTQGLTTEGLERVKSSGYIAWTQCYWWHCEIEHRYTVSSTQMCVNPLDCILFLAQVPTRSTIDMWQHSQCQNSSTGWEEGSALGELLFFHRTQVPPFTHFKQISVAYNSNFKRSGTDFRPLHGFTPFSSFSMNWERSAIGSSGEGGQADFSFAITCRPFISLLACQHLLEHKHILHNWSWFHKKFRLMVFYVLDIKKFP